MPEWKPLLTARLGKLRLHPAREQEIVDELSQHLDDRYEELRAAGAGHDEAVRLAIDEVEDEELLAREMRTLKQSFAPEPIAAGALRTRLLSDLWRDLIYAVRTLRKNRGFALAAILTLALGIGANTAIFSLVNATLLQRLPVSDRDRLVNVFRGAVGGVFSYPGYAALRDGNRQLDALVAWAGISASLNADGETDLVSGVIVTGNFFEVLGVSPERGRLLSRADDVTPGAHPVTVISHRLWQTRFTGRPDIVGQQIRLNGQVFTIVGVTRPEFEGPQLGATRDLYVPMMMQALMRPPRAGYSGEMNPDLLKNADNGWLFAIGRLKPGVTPAQAQAELEALTTTFVRGARPNAPPQRVTVLPVDEGDPNQRQQLRAVATLLGATVGAVLLIACANVANLLLSKATARRRELAIRLAIGASRWRIVRQLLTESILLAGLGGAGGVTLAWAVVEIFRDAPPPPGALPLAIDFSVDLRVLIFSAVLSLLTGVAFGVAPALQASRPGLVPALKDESFMGDERARRFNVKKSLVVVEVALSLLLLIAAGLFLRSLQAAQAIDPGFAAEEIISAPLNVNLLRYTKIQGRQFYQRIVERMEHLPGVRSASLARIAVLTGGSRVTSIRIEGRPASEDRVFGEGGRATADRPETALANVVGPRFFQTLGIPLLRGRDFAPDDNEDHPLVAIVSEAMVRRFFPGEDPIGKRFTAGSSEPNAPWTEIIGVVRDSKYATLAEEPAPVVYVSLAQRHETGVTLYVRAAVPPATLASALRREVQSLEPNLPVPNIQTMSETIGRSLYAARMGAWLLAVFGGLALLLASIGVYGVLAFSIARRTRELGIRMALGADRTGLFRLVISEGMWLVAIGLGLGLGIGFFASRSIAAFLFGINPRDTATFALVPCILAAVALVACYLPARRAMKVNPIVALRDT